MTIEQMQARLAEINAAIDTAEGETLTNLETEARSLMDDLAAARDEAQRRQALRGSIAAGAGVVQERRDNAPQAQTPENVADTDAYRGAWLRNLQGRTLSAQERALVTATAAIPTRTMNRIISVLEENPLIAAVEMTYIPGYVSYPVEGTNNDANWVAMGTAATDSADTLTSVTLSAYKLIKTIEIGADVSAMGIDAFEDWLVVRLANKVEAAVDAGILTGTGSSQATGLLKNGEITNTGTFTKAGMTYKDLLAILAALPTKYARRATLVMNRALFFGDVLGITDTSGHPVVVADPQSPAKYNVLGYPVIVDDNCTADTLIFGDLKQYAWNFAQVPTVENDRSAGFRAGTTVFRAMALADGKILDKNAFVKYTRAS